MPDFITLSCPSCGNKLQITEDIDRFACAAWGNEHIVNRSGGIVTLRPVIENIAKLQAGVDKTASDLAIVRLKQEILELDNEYNAAIFIAKNAAIVADRNAAIIAANEKSRTENEFPWGVIIALAVLLTAVLLIIPNTRVLGVYIGIFTVLFSITTLITNSTKESDGNELEEPNILQNVELEKLEKEVMTLKSKLEGKKRELVEHQLIVSKYQ